ncbi:hypothetical protein SS33_03620 [Enterobacter kobei]|nr:hypothetical protein C2U44_33380 [Klebsiella oxytoca]KJM96079.1 hypothetical protein SS33_03620 [Enterobacter kobei]MBX4663373.1 hypothetical protein [Klebsiella michiganensis]HBX3133637.1 hypothetical protein [Klebsiella pneumoniae]HBX4540171.1 hypothetical protein [Klebsiella pneumoniae]
MNLTLMSILVELSMGLHQLSLMTSLVMLMKIEMETSLCFIMKSLSSIQLTSSIYFIPQRQTLSVFIFIKMKMATGGLMRLWIV